MPSAIRVGDHRSPNSLAGDVGESPAASLLLCPHNNLAAGGALLSLAGVV